MKYGASGNPDQNLSLLHNYEIVWRNVHINTIAIPGPELATDLHGGAKRRMRKIFGAAPFTRLPHLSKPLKFAYVTFKILSKPKDHDIIF